MTSPPPRLASATPALAFGNNNNNDKSLSHTPVTAAVVVVPSLSISVPPSASAENHLTQNPPPPSQPTTTASSTSKPFTHAIPPPPSDLDPWDTAYQHDFAGLSDDAVFKAITRPPPLVPGGVEGKDGWGIPEAVGGAGCSASLQAKVSNFLKMKVEQDRHINTTLLASTAFTNPHIYTKLVEFVDIDERGSAFPGGGWLTRRGLERRIPEWGAKALSAQQKAQETALLASQSTGKRKTIDFTSSVSAGSGSGSGRSSKRRVPPPNRAGKYPQTSSSSAVVPRHLSAEAVESHIRAGERERSKRDSRSAGGDAVPLSGSRRRERPEDGAGVPGYSVNTGEGVSRRYERDRQEEKDGGKRSVQGRRWD
ncbi:hypothetical protein QFC21_002624 [Naganishia friedmannii]|uniref:Uncharacterized protein n=1 Tax=Naganishia friedmannii TaxID=89922 RepID=A0ACC2VWM8_9TREE|nr:hypothetical protein QFC21_002624 [Naganishia friedmannii]